MNKKGEFAATKANTSHEQLPSGLVTQLVE